MSNEILNSALWLIKPRICIGVMTGTSLDSIDISISKISLEHNHPTMNNIANRDFKFPEGYKNRIMEMINGETGLYDVSQMNFFYSRVIAEAVNSFVKDKDLVGKVDVIGLHGQTVWHEPYPKDYLGKQISSTLQLGNASALAKLTDIPVVSDFRSADVALGGQGAPLMPLFDLTFLRDKEQHNISLNIGGIANFTYIPPKGNEQEIVGFDTGPGNVWIDMIMNKFYFRDYDEDGNNARKGQIDEKLLDDLMQIEFIRKDPPKSTGRELFNEKLLFSYLDNSAASAQDKLSTVTAFTALSIAYNLKKTHAFNKIIVSGGGAKNLYLLELLEKYSGKKVVSSREVGINPDFKEAICWSYLAWRTLGQQKGNIKHISGALKNVVTGSISF